LLPPTMTNTVSAGSLGFSWPTEYLGWKLQTQTNNLAAGVSTNGSDWGNVAGSENSTQSSMPIDTAKPGGYFRLVSP
jgi:hypothetical protein